MAISLGQTTKTYTVENRSWRLEMNCPKGKTPDIKIYRERCETCLEDNTIRTTVYTNPIQVTPQELPSLAPFFEVPPELKALIPDEATAAMYLGILSSLLAIACDAADKKRLAANPQANNPSTSQTIITGSII